MAEPGGRSGTALLTGAVLLGIGAAAVWLLSERPLPPTDFSTSGWRPAAADVEAQAAADRAALDALGDRGDPALDEAVAEWCREEARTGGKGVDEDIRRAQTRVEEAALRALSRDGRQGYRALGLRERARFQAALDRYLVAVRASGEPLAAWDARHADAPEVAAMHEALGTFLLEAQRTELIDVHGTPSEDAPLVVPVLFMMRWALFVAQATPAEEVLTPYERRVLLGWKAWANPTLTIERRRELLQRLAAIEPRTPTHRVLALHHIREGDWRAATRETVLAILDEPDDRSLAANLAWLRQRLEGL